MSGILNSTLETLNDDAHKQWWSMIMHKFISNFWIKIIKINQKRYILLVLIVSNWHSLWWLYGIGFESHFTVTYDLLQLKYRNSVPNTQFTFSVFLIGCSSEREIVQMTLILEQRSSRCVRERFLLIECHNDCLTMFYKTSPS